MSGAGGIATVVVTPQAAADAYARTDAGGAADGGGSFGAVLSHAVEGAIAQGHAADQQAAAAIAGTGDITEVVTAIAHAQLALLTATAIRDRVVQAYQDVMRMPI
jgi:flagellar hook-basal body complex protein FliE